jgi:hypothetical protein
MCDGDSATSVAISYARGKMNIKQVDGKGEGPVGWHGRVRRTRCAVLTAPGEAAGVNRPQHGKLPRCTIFTTYTPCDGIVTVAPLRQEITTERSLRRHLVDVFSASALSLLLVCLPQIHTINVMVWYG